MEEERTGRVLGCGGEFWISRRLLALQIKGVEEGLVGF
jgi:hypothetical protein